MTKQIISFSLSSQSIETLDSVSKALGKNRSQLIEWLLETMGESIKEKAAKINLMQENLKAEVG